MAYVSGTAANLATLISAVQTEAVTAGWVLTNNNLRKGSAAFSLSVVGSQIEVKGGLSVSGASLVTPSPFGARICAPFVTFPVKYEIFTFNNPSEVYLVINYNSTNYQQLSFGESSVLGNKGQPWFTASLNANTPANDSMIFATLRFHAINLQPKTGVSTNSAGLFVRGDWSGEAGSSGIYSTQAPVGWKGAGTPSTSTGIVQGSSDLVAGLLQQLPSLFNSSTVLLPVKCVIDGGSKGLSVAANLNNARLCRIDNIEPGATLTFGSEKWKVFPWLRKDIASRNGELTNNTSGGSGTYGYAIRYEGP